MTTASIPKKPRARALADPSRSSRGASLQAQEATGTMRMVTLRMPDKLIADLKDLAKSKRRPYQTMARAFLEERLEAERGFRS